MDNRERAGLVACPGVSKLLLQFVIVGTQTSYLFFEVAKMVFDVFGVVITHGCLLHGVVTKHDGRGNAEHEHQPWH